MGQPTDPHPIKSQFSELNGLGTAAGTDKIIVIYIEASVNQNWTEAYSMVWALALAEENQYKASVFDSLTNVVITSCYHRKTAGSPSSRLPFRLAT